MKKLERAIIVYDTETTGTHEEKKLLEIGAVCVNTSGTFVSEFQTLVWQPREVLDHPDSQDSFKIHRIPKEDILSKGKREDDAIGEFADWVNSQMDEHGVESITAFNNKFDNGMVPQLFDIVNISVGECLMLSSMPPMIAAGVAYRWPNQYRNDSLGLAQDDPRRFKWPSAVEAKAYFESIGYEFPVGPEHRALPDARKEAIMAIAIYSERMKASISDEDFEEMYADFEHWLRQESYREFHEWKEEMTQRHYENIHTHRYERTQEMGEELSTHRYEVTRMTWEGIHEDPSQGGPIPGHIVKEMIEEEVESYRQALQDLIDEEISQQDEDFNEYMEQAALDMEAEIQRGLDYFRNSR